MLCVSNTETTRVGTTRLPVVFYIDLKHNIKIV